MGTLVAGGQQTKRFPLFAADGSITTGGTAQLVLPQVQSRSLLKSRTRQPAPCGSSSVRRAPPARSRPAPCPPSRSRTQGSISPSPPSSRSSAAARPATARFSGSTSRAAKGRTRRSAPGPRQGARGPHRRRGLVVRHRRRRRRLCDRTLRLHLQQRPRPLWLRRPVSRRGASADGQLAAASDRRDVLPHRSDRGLRRDDRANLPVPVDAMSRILAIFALFAACVLPAAVFAQATPTTGVYFTNIPGYTSGTTPLTRPANTTAYAASETVCTATSVTVCPPVIISIANVFAGQGLINRFSMLKSGSSTANASFRVVALFCGARHGDAQPVRHDVLHGAARRRYAQLYRFSDVFNRNRDVQHDPAGLVRMHAVEPEHGWRSRFQGAGRRHDDQRHSVRDRGLHARQRRNVHTLRQRVLLR